MSTQETRLQYESEITIFSIHLAEDIRCTDDIQLLEGPILPPCPPGLEASANKAGFDEFLFEIPAGEYEVEGIFASPKICIKKYIFK